MKQLICLLFLLPALAEAISGERCWEVGISPIYWKPCASSWEYANDLQGANTRILSLTADYDWGFRLHGATFTKDCCHCWWLDWVYLRTTDGAQKGGTSLVTPQGQTLNNAPLAKASLKYRYNRVNLRAGRYIARHCKSMTYAFGGLRYVDIQRRQSVQVSDLTPALARIFEKAEFEGAAFEVGAGVEIEEPWNLYAVGEIAGLMNIGARRSEVRTLIGDLLTRNESACTAGLQGRAGVEYRYQAECLWLSIQINYQIEHYFDVLRLTNPGNPLTTSTHNVGFAGPGLQVAARF